VFKIARMGLMAAAMLLPATVLAEELQGDAEAGRKKAQVCAACHGQDGNSPSPATPQLVVPKIAGQGKRYFISQLKAFKEGAKGSRQGANALMMYSQAAGLSDQDMADLAAYFSSQKVAMGAASDELAKKGAAIYQGGNMDFGSAACIGCHGPGGNGNPAAGFPALAGQHASYTYNQLKAFHDGTRSGDPNSMMRHMVRKMSDTDMRAVAEYIQGLYE
jgi:cytochrome c553